MCAIGSMPAIVQHEGVGRSAQFFAAVPRRATNGCLEGRLPPRMLKPSTSRKEPLWPLQKKLIAVRRAHHLTREQLAAKLFVTRQAVSRWERGEVTPAST